MAAHFSLRFSLQTTLLPRSVCKMSSSRLLLQSLFIVFMATTFVACHSARSTTLTVRNSAKECITFEYAILRHPYSPTDTLSQPTYQHSTKRTLSLSISEPTFVSVRAEGKSQNYLLLLSPKENAELQLLPLGYRVEGSAQSSRICELYELFKRFNDSVQVLKHAFEWNNSLEFASTVHLDVRRDYDSLVSLTRRNLVHFIAKEPLSKVNLLALEARYNGDQYFFTSPRERAFAREVAEGIASSYTEAEFAQKVLQEYADE